jgi:hypothetical protein
LEDFSITCYGIGLDAFDLILGFQFLRSLGKVLWDLDTLSMTFLQGSCQVVWTGLGAPPASASAPAAHTASIAHDNPLLGQLLEQFSCVFTEPQGLPPTRPYDHRIHLLPGTAPVAVHPYRYPPLQKDELERQCAAMLAQGIIRPSTSPFSAPVPLIRKPDNSWRFCIDYRALNAKTSKDKFPIPVVEELLDELFGARFFTKLDCNTLKNSPS